MNVFNTYYLPTKHESLVATATVSITGAAALAIAPVQKVALGAFIVLSLALATKILSKFFQARTELKTFQIHIRHRRLEFQGMDLDALPESICTRTNLSVINLGFNKLIALPDTISALGSLTTLNLCVNKLTLLPEKIGMITTLSALDLDGNKLTALPESIATLTNLSILKLQGNNLRTLPNTISALTKLTFLNLKDNKLIVLPESIGKLTTLSKLLLNNNKLTTLPASIGRLTNLKHLYLQENHLTSLPKSITALKNLSQLYPSNNQLTALPKSLDTLSNFYHLNLEGNLLPTLPKAISALTNLTFLNLANNKLTNLPKSISALSNLSTLKLEGNQFTTLPESVGALHRLRHLYLKDNRFCSLPSTITTLSRLFVLHLNNNNLTTLPESISALCALSYFEINNNKLNTLPESIGALSRLTKLSLSNNKLTTLPESMSALTKLSDLILEGNLFTSFETIGVIRNLYYLNLKHNQLTTLPETIGRLRRLANVNLQHNQLTILPSTIGNLPILYSIKISYNPNLNQLPMSLGECAHITHLSTEGTAITEENVTQILNLTQAKRERGAVEVLPERLKMWCGYAGESINNVYTLDFVETLTDRQKIDLNEWLVRLAKSREFNKNQSALATSALEMVQTIGESDEWKESFFAQVASNNTACGDRAAQAFNELYTAWRIQNLPGNAALRDKLALLERAGRTFAMREFMANRVSDQNQSELVEVYLFYETKFKNQLNLLTAVNSMLYAEIGQRDWIDEKALVNFVKDNALSKMADFEATAKLAETDTEFKEEREAIRETISVQLEQIDTANEQAYTDAVNQLMNDKKKAEKALLVKWVNAKLKHPIRGFHAEQA